MTIRDYASVRMICEVCLQPRLLRRPRAAPTQTIAVAIGIECHDVPAAQLETVVALAWGAGLRAPILEIATGCRVDVLVITQGGPGTVLESPPRRSVTKLKFIGTSAFVGQVTRGKYGSRDLLNQQCRCPCTLRLLAASDIACTYQNVGFLRRFLFQWFLLHLREVFPGSRPWQLSENRRPAA